jgi:glutaconate CoA-transferase subunit B
MYLDSYHRGSSVREVKENSGWEINVSPKVRETPPPTEWQVRLLREELDPKGIFLRKPGG